MPTTKKRLTKSQLYFEVYQGEQEEWRWRLKHKNGNIVADSGESYKNRTDCLKTIRRLRKDTATAPVAKSQQVCG